MVVEGMKSGKGWKPRPSSLLRSLDLVMIFATFSHIFPQLEGSVSVCYLAVPVF